MRLDKYLCECNIGTRSEVKKIISSGRVKVNDNTITSSSIHIMEDKDVVSVDEKLITYKRFRYYILNKPSGCVTAVKDNVHTTVIEYLAGENIKDCAPVGRLDLDTEGLLLITNDGELAHRLLSPSKHVDKRYFAILDRECPKSAIDDFKTGIDIGDEKNTLPAILEILDNKCEARLTIHEGRFHQVKRMFESVGCNVEYLKRETFGSLELGELNPGEYRELSLAEVEVLKGV